MTHMQGHILVVDDNQANRTALVHMLEEHGHTVAVAKYSQHILAHMQTQPVDLVVLAMALPQRHGEDILNQILRDPTLQEIPVLMLGEAHEDEAALRYLASGAHDYMLCPLEPVVVQARLQAALHTRHLHRQNRLLLLQEQTLRQNEKLVMLGKLSAGMTHDLNNPVTAAQRGSEQLRETLSQLQQICLKLSMHGITEESYAILLELEEVARQRAGQPVYFQAVERSTREATVETWLKERGIERSWELAPNLVCLGYERPQLDTLAETFSVVQLPVVISWFSLLYTVYTLLEEVNHGAGRIAAIVRALKAYTYMDQAESQSVSIHEGLDNTLVLLNKKLKSGVAVRREYTYSLPVIEAYESDLNQVWTNIIDNAIAAMRGRGELILRTYYEEDRVVVQIEDSGPGIPEHLQKQVFEPFFTTKPPGEGTGLGLYISHDIIVNKHMGSISLSSQPGQTCFEIRLPLQAHTVR